MSCKDAEQNETKLLLKAAASELYSYSIIPHCVTWTDMNTGDLETPHHTSVMPLTHLLVCPSVLLSAFKSSSFLTSYPVSLKSPEKEGDRAKYAPGRVTKRLSCQLRDIFLFLAVSFLLYPLSPFVLSLHPPIILLSTLLMKHWCFS